MTDDTRYNVNESHDKIRLSLKLTRGTGTRDQEAHTLKVRANDPAQAAERARRTIDELTARGVFEDCRRIQPTDDAE